MVAGHLQIKKGYFYIVLSYKDENGKRKTQWTATGLKEKGNKKRAEALLMEARKEFVPPHEMTDNMLLTDYLDKWVEIYKHSVAEPTYCNYKNAVRRMNTYFKPKNLVLEQVKAKDIQDFYNEMLGKMKSSSVLSYHLILHNAFEYAVKMDMIPMNPCDKVQRPKPGKFHGAFCDEKELQKLFEISKGNKLELAIKVAVFYGMRRSEVVGLRWKAIDFDNNTITVNHTITEANNNGKLRLIVSDKAKTKSSLRTYPLTDEMKRLLLEKQAKTAANKEYFGNTYNHKYDEYVFVDDMGNLIAPNSITFSFKRLVKANGMDNLTFHSLRHTCASLMVANGVNMKHIQDWLGHSTFTITADFYSHLDSSAKQLAADAMTGVMKSVGEKT